MEAMREHYVRTIRARKANFERNLLEIRNILSPEQVGRLAPLPHRRRAGLALAAIGIILVPHDHRHINHVGRLGALPGRPSISVLALT